MKAKLIAIAGVSALALAAPAAAAPGHCFTASGQPIGPVFDTERPDTAFVTWVQARGGECRALRADEVTLYRESREYPREYRRVEVERRPVDVAPGAPRSAPELPPPPTGTVMWEGDPAMAHRLIVTHYTAAGPVRTVVDTGQVIVLEPRGSWRIYETVHADGTRRRVAVQMRTEGRYVLMESRSGGGWSEAIVLQE